MPRPLKLWAVAAAAAAPTAATDAIVASSGGAAHREVRGGGCTRQLATVLHHLRYRLLQFKPVRHFATPRVRSSTSASSSWEACRPGIPSHRPPRSAPAAEQVLSSFKPKGTFHTYLVNRSSTFDATSCEASGTDSCTNGLHCPHQLGRKKILSFSHRKLHSEIAIYSATLYCNP